jgi:pyruvate dehydrogenase E1 component alpha subunit/2-oxoisovalerate dehydrogenase E1 component
MGTAIERHQAQLDLPLKARGYAVASESVDGMDVLAVEAAARRAADHVRAGKGPFLLEAKTYRFRAHSAYDPELYRSKEEVERWKKRDPIPALENVLREAGLLEARDVEVIERDAAKEIEEAIAFADSSPWEPVEDLLRDVYAASAPEGGAR